MRTLLSQFCEAFDGTLRPLLEPLSEATRTLAASDDSNLDLPEVRAELHDLQHQIQGLVEKVADQQAYVLLFGPLKSGKSTLMNALAGAYVSEVSSLPAYPCMVYLSHAQERNFYVTRYNGETERFTDPSALYGHIARAHGDLAERLRAAEAQGKEFEPSLHFAEAIRKVDVRMPAGELSSSGAVLVDTPGLYSRMKFGYDRMTRDFRDSASCAIFVVKSDNLFLEQVFAEFEDLLDLFSRIFLVVNLDTTKTDLSPDGTLVPSLEQEDPLRIIDAFENLAMSAPLKDAADEGRLKIYPVDLLRAASHRLREREPNEAPARGQANFDAFLEDLTEYLNSTDYLVAFLGDSLRRAENLLDDLDGIVEHENVAALRAHTDALDQRRQDLQRQRHAVHRLEAFDWREAFTELDEKLSPTIRERSRAARAQTERDLDELVDGWFRTDASFESLVKDELGPRLAQYEEDLTAFVAETLEDEVRPGTAGLLLPSEVGADLHAAGLDLTELGVASLSAMDRGAVLGHVDVPVAADRVPVRKSLLDWLLLRTRASCQRRLFGDVATPSARISPERKQARLGEDARLAIRRELDVFKARFFEDTVQRAHRHLIGRYADSAVASMRARLKGRDEELAKEVDSVVDQLVEHRKVLSHLASLRTVAAQARGGVDELAAEYAQTEPEKLIQPAPPGQLPSFGEAAARLLPEPLVPFSGTEDGEAEPAEEVESGTPSEDPAAPDVAASDVPTQ
ncbi:MAG: dynamin family protein [Planctomycetota bacterium]